MKVQVFINPKKISITDRAFNYGDGLFETILVKDNEPLHLSEHILRLNNGCKRLNIPLPSKKIITNSIEKCIGNTKCCIIKIIYSRGSSEHGYSYENNIIPIMYFIKKSKTNIKNEKLIKLGFSKYQLSNNSYLSKIKHLNRLEQILGASFVDETKFDNYILTDKNNNIIECVSSNIFFYKITKDKYNFITPNLCNAGVDGIMKTIIMKFMKRNKMNLSVKEISKKDVPNYHGAFICNSISGIQFVTKIGRYILNHDINLERIFSEYVYE